MSIKRILIPLLLILFMTSMAAFGAPVYVNVGPTTEFDGDIKILSEIVAEGTTADGWETTIFFTDPTADRTITIPDADVTVGVVTGIVPPDHGGTGIANNAASTITITGNFATTITVSNVTTVTLPTSGIIVSDNNACTDIEGTGLSIAGGVLNWACTVNGIDSDNYTDGSIDHEHLAPDVISGLVDTTSADADYMMFWDATDSLLKKCDMGEVRGGAGGATTALDNLAAVQINTTLLSDAADTDSLGTAAAEWLNLYIGDLGKIYCGLGQDTSIHRSAAGVMTLTAANGVVTSAALTVTGALGIGANNLTLTGYVGRDADNFLGFDVDNTLKIEINNVLHSIVSISDGGANNDKLCTQGYADDAAAGGGANVALSNLAGVAINLSLVSDAADTDSLGSATSEWLNLYLGTYGTVYFGTGQTENIAETALNELTITATTVAVSGTLAMGANNLTTTGTVGRDTDNYLGWGVDNSLAIKINGIAHAIVSITDGFADNDKLATQGYVDDQVAGANANLSNLAAVAINTTLISDAADTDSLGDATHEWLNLYIGDAGKIYLGLGQDTTIHRSAANTLTLTASTATLLTGPLGVTGTRVSKGWFTDLEVTNAIAGSITGTARGLVSVANADITIQPNGTGDTIIYAPADVVTTKNGVATLTIAEAGTVLVSAAGAAYTLTLPTAVGHSGLRYHFIKTDANYTLITLDGNAAETLNYENSTGTPNTTYGRLNTYCAEVTIVSDGANWQVIDEALGQVPDCWVYLSVDQQDLSNAIYNRIDLDTEEYDIGSNYNVANWVSGNATATSAWHLVDAGGAFTAAMVGKRIKNTTDTTYTYITVCNSATDLTVRDDIFVDTEGYEIKHSKFVAPVSGKYLISYGFWLDEIGLVANVYYFGAIRLNDSLIMQTTLLPAVVKYCDSGKTFKAAASKDDYIELFFYSGSGNNLVDVHADGKAVTYIQVVLVSKD